MHFLADLATDTTGTMATDTMATDYDVQSLQESLGLQISEIEMLLRLVSVVIAWDVPL